MEKIQLPKGTRVGYRGGNANLFGTITASNNRSYGILWDNGVEEIYFHDEIVPIFPAEMKQYNDFSDKIRDRLE